MNGKVLKVFNNDLYGNPDERYVSVFAVFEHKKYMNKYCLFAIDGEYYKKELYYGSIHVKDKSLIIFAVNDAAMPYIDEFCKEYLGGKVNTKEYELIDISNCERAELISSTKVSSDDIEALDKMSITREVATKKSSTTKNGKGGLYFLLILFVLLGLGLTYLYFNPSLMTVELKMLNCNKESFNKVLDMDYQSTKIVRFNKKEKPGIVENIDVYTFSDKDTYNDFKDNNKENTYFKMPGEYKYDDESLELKIYYNEDYSILNSYDEMHEYLLNEGYTCSEETYEE